MKPVAAGADRHARRLRNDDALALQAASGVPLSYELVNPCCLPRATAPHLAAATRRATHRNTGDQVGF